MVSVRTGVAPSQGSYAASFGLLPSETIYHPGMAGVGLKDMRPELSQVALKGAEQKAFFSTSGGAGTAGYATIPIYVDQLIVDISRKYTPLTELIARVSNMGVTADYVRVTAKGSAFTQVEGGALNPATHTRARVSKAIKYLYADGLVSGQAQVAVPGYMLAGFNPTGSGLGAGNPFASANAPDALQQEVLLAVRSLKEMEENLIINGNSTTSGISGNPNGTEFDGIIALQSTTNQTDLAGGTLEWDHVETAVQNAFADGGRPNLGLCSMGVMTRLRQIMLDTFRFSPNALVGEIAFGIPAQLMLHTTVGPIPVIQSMYLTDTAGSRRLYFLDMDWIEMRVLQDMTYQEKGITLDGKEFFLKIYETLIMRAPEFNSSIIGIA